MKNKSELQKIKMRINTLIDIEETKLRIALQQEQADFLKIQLLANFRPNASLRQINNQRKINLSQSDWTELTERSQAI
jgi:hypothetical protein